MSKKAAFILFAGIIFCFSAKAQKDAVVYYMKTFRVSETVSFDEHVKIKEKDSADFSRVMLSPDTNTDKNLFIVKDYYMNGKPKMLGKSTNRNYILNLKGVCIEFFQNGRRKSVKNYDNNSLLGDASFYYPNGKLYLIGTYDKNHKLIINECRDSTGKILAANSTGHCIEYGDDFKYVFAEGDIINGLEDGVWNGFLIDSTRYVCNYEKGVLTKGTGYDKKGGTYSFTTTDMIDPSFKGGTNAFYGFLQHNMHYPAVAKENNVQGKVLMTFVVNKNGQLSNLKIVRGIGSGCDEEVIRVMNASPPWIPATQFGMPVRVPYTMPISFTLTRDN
jgi:TonB family protein